MTAERSDFFGLYFAELAKRLLDASTTHLETLCDSLRGARDRGRKVIIAGNGASAAIASHVSVDLTKAGGIRAVNFNESDLITCFGNDYGYENWIAKALEFYADGGDLAIFVSSSGRSPNVVNGARTARQLGLGIVTLSGFSADNPLRSLGDLNLWVDSSRHNIVETTHQSWLLAAIDSIASDGANRF